MRQIKRIFVHCTAGSLKQTKDDLLREFKARGWSAPGYHYVVFPDGRVDSLLAEEKISNGVQGFNSTAINVAYVGGIDSKGRAVDNRTEMQKTALMTLLGALKRKYPDAHVMGHRDIWGKDPKNWKKQCPCFDATSEYAFLDGAGLHETSNAETEYGFLDDVGKVEHAKNDASDKYFSPLMSNTPSKLERIIDKIKKLTPWGK